MDKNALASNGERTKVHRGSTDGGGCGWCNRQYDFVEITAGGDTVETGNVGEDPKDDDDQEKGNEFD